MRRICAIVRQQRKGEGSVALPLRCGFEFTPEFFARHAECGVVRAGKDARDFAPIGGSDDRTAEVAGRGRLLQPTALGKRMHVDIPVGAIVSAEAAADAMAFDLNLFALAVAVNGIDGATDQAVGVGTGAATARDKPFVDA